MKYCFKRANWAGSLLLWAVCLGCGSEGKRVHLKGTVHFAGQPVPYGNIVFEADATKGYKGPQGYATIKDGSFDTKLLGGTSPTSGTHKVIVEGYPELGREKPGQGRLVFKHTFVQDLTPAQPALVIEIPEKSAKREGSPPDDLPPP